MAEGAQCVEDGPFFPTTPRYVIQSGMGPNRNILISPDWLYIGLMLGSFFLLVIILAFALVSIISYIYLSHFLDFGVLFDNKIFHLLPHI